MKAKWRGALLVVAAMLFLGRPAAADLTPLAGGPGGSEIYVSCGGGRLAGLTLSYGAWVDWLLPLCVKVDAKGAWAGTPAPYVVEQDPACQPNNVPRVRLGTSCGGGNGRLDLKCPIDSIVYGFDALVVDGRYLVARITLHCVNPMTGAKVTVAMPAPSGQGESYSQSPPFDCPAWQTGWGIYGRSGVYLDAFGLNCGAGPMAPPALKPLITAAMVKKSASTFAAEQPPAPPKLLTSPARQSAAAVLAALPPADLPAGPTPGVKAGTNLLRYNYPYITDSSGKPGLTDWCREWGTNCGLLAAAAYCASVDNGKRPKVADYAEFGGAGRFRETVVISSRAACTAPSCSAFSYIVCGK